MIRILVNIQIFIVVHAYRLLIFRKSVLFNILSDNLSSSAVSKIRVIVNRVYVSLELGFWSEMSFLQLLH